MKFFLTALFGAKNVIFYTHTDESIKKAERWFLVDSKKHPKKKGLARVTSAALVATVAVLGCGPVLSAALRQQLRESVRQTEKVFFLTAPNFSDDSGRRESSGLDIR